MEILSQQSRAHSLARSDLSCWNIEKSNTVVIMFKSLSKIVIASKLNLARWNGHKSSYSLHSNGISEECTQTLLQNVGTELHEKTQRQKRHSMSKDRFVTLQQSDPKKRRMRSNQIIQLNLSLRVFFSLSLPLVLFLS